MTTNAWSCNQPLPPPERVLLQGDVPARDFGCTGADSVCGRSGPSADLAIPASTGSQSQGAEPSANRTPVPRFYCPLSRCSASSGAGWSSLAQVVRHIDRNHLPYHEQIPEDFLKRSRRAICSHCNTLFSVPRGCVTCDARQAPSVAPPAAGAPSNSVPTPQLEPGSSQASTQGGTRCLVAIRDMHTFSCASENPSWGRA